MKALSGCQFRHAVLFGGSGFIGSHLAAHLRETGAAKRITLVDIRPPKENRAGWDTISYVQWDVRTSIPSSICSENPDLIVNLAAVHREPGHQAFEYFETNIKRGRERLSIRRANRLRYACVYAD